MGFFSRKISINYELKKTVDGLISAAGRISSIIAEDIKNDLLLFVLKQTAADGKVADEEVQFINEYLGMSASVHSVINYLNQYHSAIRDIKLPTTVEKLCAFYKSLDDDKSKELAVSLMNVFLVVLIEVCKEVISIDGSIDDDEIEGLNEIINTCSDYIEDALGFVPDGVEHARKQLVD